VESFHLRNESFTLGRESAALILVVLIGVLYLSVRIKQQIFIKIAIKDCLQNNGIACKMAEHYEQDALLLSRMLMEREFLLGREEMNDTRRSGRSLILCSRNKSEMLLS
jgi:hypothetical protein